MRLFTAICVLALAVAFTAPAFAETQNIKVSGDLKVAHVYQNELDEFSNATDDTGQPNFFIQQVGLNVEADLTDNVSTYVRLINEREWNAETNASQNNSGDAWDVTLDEAYVTLKEMLYAPLTVKVGRQNIWLGKGFVIGNAGAGVWDTLGNLPSTVRELSDATAFDAIRATLDYDPWTIDLIYAKIDASAILEAAATSTRDDLDLYVLNVGYDFEKYDAEAEAYYIHKHDRSTIDTTVITPFDRKTSETETIGLRGSLVPFDQMNIWGEGAIQFGNYVNTTRNNDRDAWALNLGGDYTLADVKWTPVIGLEYTIWSGEPNNYAGDWKAWDPLYPGKFDTQIGAFREITKVTTTATTSVGNDNGATNQQQLAIYGALEPMTDITLSGKVTSFWFDEVPVSGSSDEIGLEIDAKLVYDYTEDVQFAVAGGIFMPGDFYPTTADDTASQLISAITVDF